MSSAMPISTSFINSPPLASSPDAGFVPVRQSYSAREGIQKPDPGQVVNDYEQYTCTNVALDHAEQYTRADKQLQAPLLVRNRTHFPEAGHASESHPSRRFSTARTSKLREPAMTEHMALPLHASEPPWPSTCAQGLSSYGQHFQGHPMNPNHSPHQQLGEHTLDIGLGEHQESPCATYQPQFEQLLHDASPYPQLPHHQHSVRQHATEGRQPPGGDDTVKTGESDCNEKLNTCTARCLYLCLLEAPNHTRTLKEIYSWFKTYTVKANAQGWDNGVRHNLSMNKAFVKPNGPGDRKKLGVWKLHPSAVANGGVPPSSAHRPKTINTKSTRKGTPAPKRAKAGAKGGQATREARSRREGKQLVRQHRAMQHQYASAPQPYYAYPTPADTILDSSAGSTPMFHAASTMTPMTSLSSPSSWATPQPDVLPHSELLPWSEVEFEEFHHPMPTASDYMPGSPHPPPPQHQNSQGFDDMQLDPSLRGDFNAGSPDDQAFSAVLHMPVFGFETDDDLQALLQRDLEELQPVY